MMKGSDSSFTTGVTKALTTPKTAPTASRVSSCVWVSPPTRMPSSSQAAAPRARALTTTRIRKVTRSSFHGIRMTRMD